MQVKIPESPRDVRHLIGGSWAPMTGESLPVTSPYTGTIIGRVPLARQEQVAAAVDAARQAFPAWRATSLKERCRILFQFRELVLKHLDELGHLAAAESGKTVDEGKAGVMKGIEVCEFALSLQNLDSGGAMDVSRGVSCEYRREPLGIVAGIVPFNFPAMVPMWMFPIAVTLGNCFILKPSEKVPLTMTRISELMQEAGFPAGVFSLVHGDRRTVESIIDHQDVSAVAFVGSTPVAKAVYQRTTALGKRALCLGGAKNFLMVVPDADHDMTVDGVIKSFLGCAGQRCMAASLMLAIGDVQRLIDSIVARAREVRLGTDMGAIVDAAAKQRIIAAIDKAESDGCKLLLDGRHSKPPTGYEGGFWVGPTIIDGAKPDQQCATDEIFGPVLTIVRVPTLPQALCLEHGNRYGNATSIFTTNGAVARYVAESASSGMIGINVGVPVPREPFSFGGTKESKFGQGDITGEGVLDFWTQKKKITIKWEMQRDLNWMS